MKLFLYVGFGYRAYLINEKCVCVCMSGGFDYSENRSSEYSSSGAKMKTNTSCGQCSHPGCITEVSDKKTTAPCSEKCICYLTRTLAEIKNKIAAKDTAKKTGIIIEVQSRILNEYASSNEEIRCNVELTPSEAKLFGAGVVKHDSMVCCVLVRELRNQKRDLEGMMASWVEFTGKADRFALVISEIRDKLTKLTPRIDSIVQETKVLEEIELVNEETRGTEFDNVLRRSEERREIFRETVHNYVEAEARHHLEHLARREKLEALERDRLMDRAALKLALQKMIKIMSTEDSAKLAKDTGTSGQASLPNPRITEKSRSPTRNTTSNKPQIQISKPHRAGYQNNENFQEYTRRNEIICPGYFCDRRTARRPF